MLRREQQLATLRTGQDSEVSARPLESTVLEMGGF